MQHGAGSQFSKKRQRHTLIVKYPTQLDLLGQLCFLLLRAENIVSGIVFVVVASSFSITKFFYGHYYIEIGLSVYFSMKGESRQHIQHHKFMD